MEFIEETVFIGENEAVVGIVTLPKSSEPCPAVLLLHGFASHKNEVGDMFADLAAKLAAQGIGSLRIDFRGWGESGGAMEETTIPRLLEDAVAASQFLASHARIDPARMGILGFSLGAATAVLTTTTLPNQFKTMALWAPAMRLREQFIESLGAENVAYAKKHGQVTIDLGWRSVMLNNDFFASLDLFHPEKAIEQFQGAVLAIAGSLDSAAENAKVYVEAAPTTQKQLLILEGANHTFNVLSDDQTVAAKVIGETQRWLLETLR